MDQSVEAHLVFRYEIYLYHAQFVDRFLNTTCSFNAIPYTLALLSTFQIQIVAGHQMM